MKHISNPLKKVLQDLKEKQSGENKKVMEYVLKVMNMEKK